ncbi:sensor histidine kinase [Paractinoplanes rishiriensis]|uniref:histidine kinase n=1 Tax=Paractinoplanes rishiriensis TaxID=1050105 RepID=A0A919JWE5_9ACTN|nr:histidine kinase [Actinoplanes rishiriensis]GIE94504.1 two-component sensor histidine kinase [Actinoplanes rishiriensis]
MTRLRSAVLPLLLIAVGLVTLPLIDRMPVPHRPVGALAAAFVVAAGALTALRHRWPVVTVLATAAITSAYLLAGYPFGPILLAFAAGVYTLARERPLRPALAWSAVALAVLVPHTFTDELGFGSLIPATAWVVVPATLGVARRMVAEAQSRERAEAERRIVDAERLRLAQEVHDVVGHGLAAIQMQAEIALHLRATRPAQADAALTAISSASAEALAELRATLAAIAPDQAPEDRAPTPGLARVPRLCDRVRASGVTVDLTVAGRERPLPAAADVVAYRVLQESLTNVVKHSAHPRAAITIGHQSDRVELTVSNQALDADHVEGLGITGMRRRVEHLGGTLTVRHDPGGAGTFTVAATIPREAS